LQQCISSTYQHSKSSLSEAATVQIIRTGVLEQKDTGVKLSLFVSKADAQFQQIAVDSAGAKAVLQYTQDQPQEC